jgi:ADP-heptose:LPS heptosyltransferase
VDKRQGILLVRLKSIGDILFTLPTAHALRAAFPQSRITFLVSKEYAPLLEGFRDVNSIIELDRRQFRAPHPLKMLSEAFSLLHRIRRERLRLTIDLQGYGETALLTRVSGAVERWGTVYRKSRSWAYTHAVPRASKVHPADNYLALLKANGLPIGPVKNEFVLPQRPQAEAEAFFSTFGLRLDRPTLFIQPLTSTALKNWPMDRFLNVAQHWRRQGWQILFGGGPGDRITLEPMRKAGFVLAAGEPLLVSAGLAKLSTVVLGGDTGLLHLAVAMGKRVVMIMSTILPGSTHPFEHRDWAIGPPAEGMITSITIETVNHACSCAAAELRILSVPPSGSQGRLAG